jgi:hypothetical protein
MFISGVRSEQNAANVTDTSQPALLPLQSTVHMSCIATRNGATSYFLLLAWIQTTLFIRALITLIWYTNANIPLQMAAIA